MKALAGLAALSLAAAIPARAEVMQSSTQGFVAAHIVTVAASPDEAWATLIEPSRYWDPAHSWFGEASGFTLDPVAQGCFCESDGRASVEHMRVINAIPGQMLRMSGALGPLQGEALEATLTVELQPAGEGGTEITWTYVVGGYSRLPLDSFAPAVDRVIGEQLAHLAATLGGEVEG